MTECPITGEAWAVADDAWAAGEVVGEPHWVQADPVIHVTTEFLAKAGADARAFLLSAYELGEWCPYQPDCRHARRRDAS